MHSLFVECRLEICLINEKIWNFTVQCCISQCNHKNTGSKGEEKDLQFIKNKEKDFFNIFSTFARDLRRL